ncbi:hypothetical protein TI05_16300 [Achromatium sp. WMS3]|nr:hypothetical protein TI05_16300 [Achromatium sp. WMS3]
MCSKTTTKNQQPRIINIIYTLLFLANFLYVNAVGSSVKSIQLNSKYLGYKVDNFISKNKQAILDAGHRNGISPVAIAGVIAAEWILNKNFIDSVQDKWLLRLLRMHNPQWWDKWAVKCESEALSAQPQRLIANKWPAALIASGYVMSFGPAQIQPRTAILACHKYSRFEPICQRNIKYLIKALLSEKESIRLVAVILRYEAEIWMAHTNQKQVKNNPAMLATLYSSGAEYWLTVYKHR